MKLLKLLCMLLLCLTNIMLTATADYARYVPYMFLYNGDLSQLCLVTGLLTIFLLSRRRGISLPDVTSTASLRSTTRATSTTSLTRTTSAARTINTTSTTSTSTTSTTSTSTTSPTSTTRATSTTSTTTTSPIEPLECKRGYTLHIETEKTNFCLRVVTECLSWNDARAACKNDNADLAVFEGKGLEIISGYLEAKV
ncbi:hypothetical protein CHS0354_027035, partial [Potamilus streckersoni]